MTQQGSAQFKFNNFQEIRSHSSHLYNERLAILFYLLDMEFIKLNQQRDVPSMYRVHSVLKQIYKNIRMLLRFNAVARVQLNLETKNEGIYTTDLQMGTIDKMLRFCESDKYTPRRINIIIVEMEELELVLKDVLQYFMYFVRPDFRQKPDIDTATAKYKEMADPLTVEELLEVSGKRNKIDFNTLGNDRIDFKDEIEYDPDVDGPLGEYSNEESELELEEDDIDED